jgi:hypothetical protein
MKLTYKKLLKAGACLEQATKFLELFGEHKVVKVTEALCLEHADTFMWSWAGRHLLPHPIWLKYNNAEYEANKALHAAMEKVNMEYLSQYLCDVNGTVKRYRIARDKVIHENNCAKAMIFGKLAETV